MKKGTKIFQKSFLFFFLFIIISKTFYAQKNVCKKNASYITTGLIYSLTICYEHEIKTTDENKRTVLRGMGGYGIRIFEFEGPVAAVMINSIKGSGNKYLEYGAGLSIEIMENIAYKRDFKIWPAVNIGYRYQKPGGKFIFRTGGGWPEAAYVSIGRAF